MLDHLREPPAPARGRRKLVAAGFGAWAEQASARHGHDGHGAGPTISGGRVPPVRHEPGSGQGSFTTRRQRAQGDHPAPTRLAIIHAPWRDRRRQPGTRQDLWSRGGRGHHAPEPLSWSASTLISWSLCAVAVAAHEAEQCPRLPGAWTCTAKPRPCCRAHHPHLRIRRRCCPGAPRPRSPALSAR